MSEFKMKTRDYSVGGRHFTLGKLEDVYVAIEHKYIDENGCMKQALNGLQMYASKTMEDCMERVAQQVRVDELVASGVDYLEAIRQVILG